MCSVPKMYYLYQIWCVLYQKCVICTKFGIPNKKKTPPFPLRHLSPLITALMIVYLFNMSCTRYAEVVSDKHALYQKARTCSCTVPKAGALASKVGALYHVLVHCTKSWCTCIKSWCTVSKGWGYFDTAANF